MNNELLVQIKEHTDTLMAQTKTEPQGTLDFKLIKKMETFSFSPAINHCEEGNWFVAVPRFKVVNFVSDKFEKTSFSISTPRH